MAEFTNAMLRDQARLMAAELMNRQVDWDRDVEAARGSSPSEAEAAVWLEDQLQARLQDFASARLNQGEVFSVADEDALADAVRVRFSPMEVFKAELKNPRVENINCNGHEVTWITEAGGVKRRGPAFADSAEEMIDKIRLLAARNSRSEKRFDPANPTLNVDLAGGHRLNAIMDVSSVPLVSIRRHGHVQVSLDDLVDLGTMDTELADFLAAAVTRPNPANILIAGGTGGGKTTLLRALIDAVASTTPDERIITIEDTVELALLENNKLLDVVELVTRDPNVEGQGEFTAQMCVKNALRMSPDRLIVGEVRGKEVVDMLEAMSIGNDGSLGTMHAESAFSAIDRVASYAGQGEIKEWVVQNLLRGAVHLIVHIKQIGSGERVITQVLELTGNKTDDGGIQTLQLWSPDESGRAERTGVQPSNRLLARLGSGAQR